MNVVDSLFDERPSTAEGGHVVPAVEVADFLSANHYLGPARSGTAWYDDAGTLVLAKPTSRSLPADGTWLELTRWCLTGAPNAGSRQWAAAARWLQAERPQVTSGNGSWSNGKTESVKDRWVYPLRPDDRREALLAIQDAAVRRRFPGAEYRDPRIRRGRIVRGTGGGNYQEHR